MRIILDNVEKEINPNIYSNFEMFLEDITNELESLGRVITEFRVDGERIEDLAHRNLKIIKLIEISSKKTNLLLLETLYELENYVGRFLDSIDEIVERIDKGNVLEAIEKLLEGINGLEWIFSVLENTEEILNMEQGQLDLLFARANEIMNKLISVLESKNYESIKVELSFGLCSLLLDIKRVIPNLSEKAVELERGEMLSN